MAVADVSAKSLADLVSLKGRSAIVTGGAQGLGWAIARRLAEAGASVLIGDINDERVQEGADKLSRATGAQVLATRMDVADAVSVAAALRLATRSFGGVDIWVNNAGIFPNVPLTEMSEEVWDQVMAVNLRGVFLGAREAARQMIAAGRGGVIINVVSTAGFKGVAPGMAAYVASKHGVRGVTKQMALELAPHGIRVLGVAPTFCVTEGNQALLAANPNSNIGVDIPAVLNSRLGRVGVADDVGRVALFCASDLSLFMTGSTLLVDAGETI